MGEVLIDAFSIYRVFSNTKGTFSIEFIEALCVEPQWVDFSKSVCNAGNGDFSITAHYDNNGNIQMNICCEIEADATEDDARLYINGYIQNTLEEKRKQLLNEYVNFKKNNSPKIEHKI